MRGVGGLLLTVAALWFVGNAPLSAQDSSHTPLPGRLDRKSAAELFNDALKRLGAQAQINPDQERATRFLGEVLKDPRRFGIDHAMLDQLRKQGLENKLDGLKLDFNDPNLQKLARELAEKFKDRIPQEDRDALKRLGDMKTPVVNPPVGNPPMGKPAVGTPPVANPPMGNPPVPNPPAGLPQPPAGTPIPGMPAPASSSPRRSAPRGWFGDQMSKLQFGKNLRLTQSLRNHISGLFGRNTRIGGVAKDVGRGTSRVLPKIDSAPLIRNLGKVMPDRMNMTMPKVDVGGGSPSISMPSLPSAEGVGYGAFAIFVVAVIIMVLFLWPRTRNWITGQGDSWRLGPWPVAPSAVRTRHDLVLAFEYLALLRLGREASAANHLDIARQLGDTVEATVQQHTAARELAELYEQARYAPPEETLSTDELDTARRDLCYLAGVAVA